MKTYSEMIIDSVITLADRKGSTRDGLWKAISSKFPDTTKAQFSLRLKKMGQAKDVIEIRKQRIFLAKDFRAKAMKRMKKGLAPTKSKATMKKKAKKVKKAKKAKKAKNAKKNGKSKAGQKKKPSTKNKKKSKSKSKTQRKSQRKSAGTNQKSSKGQKKVE